MASKILYIICFFGFLRCGSGGKRSVPWWVPLPANVFSSTASMAAAMTAQAQVQEANINQFIPGGGFPGTPGGSSGKPSGVPGGGIPGISGGIPGIPGGKLSSSQQAISDMMLDHCTWKTMSHIALVMASLQQSSIGLSQ